MFWNYRVIVRFEEDEKTPYFAIHECFYDIPLDYNNIHEHKDLNMDEVMTVVLPHSWTHDPVAIYGNNVDGLKLTLEKMKLGCDKPILIEKDDKLEEWKNE